MPARELMPLLALTLSAFLLNTSEFVPIGLLTDIAGAFDLSESGAGLMISVYAWAVAALSLPLMIAASRVPPKGLITAVLALFCAGQVTSAAAPTFELLVLARLLVAASHAVFWSVASPFAVRLVAPEHASRASSRGHSSSAPSGGPAPPPTTRPPRPRSSASPPRTPPRWPCPSSRASSTWA